MANEEQLKLLKTSVRDWNAWIEKTSSELNRGPSNEWHEIEKIEIDLREADLSGTDLNGVYLEGADLMGANLSKAKLQNAFMPKSRLVGVNLSEADARGAILGLCSLNVANLQGTNLNKADLRGSDLHFSSLKGATLQEADLSETIFSKADLSNADLRGADLSQSVLVGAKLENAQLAGCRVYGSAVWDIQGTPASQNDLIISQKGMVTTDDLEVAQFIYLMYDNKKIRNVINSITAKGVLILGRFSPPERKEVLDGLRDKLRELNLLPIVFDFDRPTDKDYTETVQTLAGMSLFVIVDVTNPKSTPLEMEATVKQFKIPFIPIIDVSVDQHPYAMIVDLQKNFHWVLQTVGYRSKEQLLENIDIAIIERARKKHEELRRQKKDDQDFMILLDDMLKAKRRSK